MKCIEIKPSKLKGSVKIPPSKSLCHRACICAALSDRESIISNVDYSDDINATIGGLESLGATIIKAKDYIKISSNNILNNSIDKNGVKEIDCIESGSTLRFLIPVALIKQNSVRFMGKGNLGNRPIEPYTKIFDMQGIKYQKKGEFLDLYLNGTLKSDAFEIDGSISSQFISGFLFALPLLEGSSCIKIINKLESKPYIDLTIDVLKRYGIDIVNNNYNSFEIKGNQKYKANDYYVEGDFSQAAFFLVAGALGSFVKCKGLNINSIQGDKFIIDILKNAKASIEYNRCENDIEEITAFAKETEGTTIDVSQCPDLVPIISVLAALSYGTTEIVNAKRLRFKECDRLKAVTTELSKLGAIIEEYEDKLIIKGREYLEGGIVDSYGDHRMAMALAIASTRCINNVVIKRSDAVSKSYPSFWEDFKALGGDIIERDME